MFVTQKRSAAASDPDCRRLKMCYITRFLSFLLVISVTVSSVIVPVSAADPELYYQNILPCNYYQNLENGSPTSTSYDPNNSFKEVSSCGYRWDPRVYDHTFSSFIVTLRIVGNDSPSKVTFTCYVGREITGTLVSHDGEYYQYRFDITSNIAYVAVQGYFDELFSGTFALYSCIAIRDIGVDVGPFSWNEYASIVPSGSSTLTQKFVKSGTNVSLPFGHLSKRTDQYQTWFYDKIYVTGAFGGYSALDQMTLIGDGQLPELPTFSILDKNETPLFILDSNDLAARYSTSMNSWGENAWQVYFWQIDVDLSGYDLKDCKWELSFTVEPSSYNSTMSFTDWMINDIFARLPVDDVPWYQVFWMWIDNNTNKLLRSIDNKITSIFGGSQVSQELSNAGTAMSDQAAEMSQAQTQLDAVDKPDLNDDMFGSMLNFNPGGLKILTAITNNGQVTAMLVVVFTFALCGYIFFGKKG